MSTASIDFDLAMITANLNSVQHSLRAVGDRIHLAKSNGRGVSARDRQEFEALVAVDNELTDARNELLLSDG